jgi:hypothetical protein
VPYIGIYNRLANWDKSRPLWHSVTSRKHCNKCDPPWKPQASKSILFHCFLNMFLFQQESYYVTVLENIWTGACSQFWEPAFPYLSQFACFSSQKHQDGIFQKVSIKVVYKRFLFYIRLRFQN